MATFLVTSGPPRPRTHDTIDWARRGVARPRFLCVSDASVTAVFCRPRNRPAALLGTSPASTGALAPHIPIAPHAIDWLRAIHDFTPLVIRAEALVGPCPIPTGAAATHVPTKAAFVI